MREVKKKKRSGLKRGTLGFNQDGVRYYIIVSSLLSGNMAFSISRERHYLFIDAFLEGTLDTAQPISTEFTQSDIHEYNISGEVEGEGCG